MTKPPGKHDTQRLFHHTWIIALLMLSFGSSCVNHEIIREPDCIKAPVTLSLEGSLHHTTCDVNGTFSVRVEVDDRTYSLYLNGSRKEIDTDPSNPVVSFQSLASGDYIVELVDVRGCSDTLHVRILDLSSELVVSVSSQTDDLCLGGNGSAMVSVAGAQGYFDLYFDDKRLIRKNAAGNIEIEDLEAGVHNIEVVDSALCSYQGAVDIPRGFTGVSWSNDVQPIIQTYCSKSGCHVPETGRVDLTSFDNVRFYSSQIKTRVLNRSMPYDGPLPADYISLIVCWIDDGTRMN